MIFKCGTCGSVWLAHTVEQHRLGCPDKPRDRAYAMRAAPADPYDYQEWDYTGD